MASDLRDEARQAHEDDRENQMTTWENWLRTDYRTVCNWCNGVDKKNNRVTAHTANADHVHALIEQAWIPIFKMHELGTSQPPVNALSMS